MEQTAIFIQEIEHLRTGEKLDLSFLLEITLVETMDLSGPRLMLEVDDPHSWVKDEIGLSEGDELRVIVADIYNRDGLDEIIDFTVLSKPSAGRALKVNAMATDVFKLKTRASSAKVFSCRSVTHIINSMFPGKQTDVGKFATAEDYHLLAGETPSYMMRQVAREHGAHIFLSRETVCMWRLADLMKKSEADFTYHHNDTSKANQLLNPSIPSTQQVLEDKIIRRYSGWNITDGWMSVGESNLPPVKTSYQSAATLKNLSIATKPSADFTCMGNGFLKAGSCLDLVWNSQRIAAPIDESLPERVIAGTVAHNYKANRYLCRVKGIVPLEGG